MALLWDLNLSPFCAWNLPESLKINHVSWCIQPTSKMGLIAVAISLGDRDITMARNADIVGTLSTEAF